MCYNTLMDGIIIVDKPSGMTSHDVVNKLRKILNTKKIGHTGTLDPEASGILVVLVGKATKVLPYLKDVDKRYIAELVLGKKTFSDDIFSETLETKEITPIQNFETVLKSFEGKIKQLPPMVSSIKINGKKLYEYARNNEYVERPLRDIEIYETKVLDVKNYVFEVFCSSGTYVRSLCVDIANKTNNLGCMGHLRRTQVGRFSLEQANTLEEIQAGNYKLYSIVELLDYLPKVKLKYPDGAYHGKKIKLNNCENDRVLMMDHDKPIAIYDRIDDTNVYKSVRGLF